MGWQDALQTMARRCPHFSSCWAHFIKTYPFISSLRTMLGHSMTGRGSGTDAVSIRIWQSEPLPQHPPQKFEFFSITPAVLQLPPHFTSPLLHTMHRNGERQNSREDSNHFGQLLNSQNPRILGRITWSKLPWQKPGLDKMVQHPLCTTPLKYDFIFTDGEAKPPAV